MLLLLACAEPPPVDLRPARRSLSPDRAWEARVDEAGELRVGPRGGELLRVDGLVDRRVAFSATHLAYAREGEVRTTDLWWHPLRGGAPAQITRWPGSEDRPAFSPDGRRLAFVGDPDGIAAVFVVDLDPLGAPIQLTNAGLVRRPGEEPAGFVPPPERAMTWGLEGLSWVARGRRWTVEVP